MFSRPSAISPRTDCPSVAGVSTADARGSRVGPRALSLLILVAAAGFDAGPSAALRVDTLKSVAAVPPQIVGEFEEPIAFQQADNGQYFVFDRRGHTVYGIDAKRTGAWKLIQIGQETGRVIDPTAFDLAPNGTFALADAPRGRERVQVFGPGGNIIGGFTLPGRSDARVTIGSLVLNGVGSLRYTGRSFLISQPETGSLFVEYSPSGAAMRSIGRLRPTSFEQDRDLHLAMNAGLPLVDPTGGFYYVFLAGTPMFRKYDAKGELVFERHIEGRELDEHIGRMPSQWPRRRVADREVPYVTPNVRAAAVDGKGQLWVSLVQPYTYVYDAAGDKVRTVQFHAAGTIAPTSLFFSKTGRLLVTPGCYEFAPVDAAADRRAGLAQGRRR